MTQLSLFPTLHNTKEVVELIKSQLPITSEIQAHSMMMLYHNTLLEELKAKAIQPYTWVWQTNRNNGASVVISNTLPTPNSEAIGPIYQVPQGYNLVPIP